MFLINRDYNMVMIQRRSLFERRERAELDFFLVVATTYFLKKDYLIKYGNPATRIPLYQWPGSIISW